MSYPVQKIAREPNARRRLLVQGIVQGVGFRPFVYRLAGRHGLTGFVENSSRGVLIEVQGPAGRLDAFRSGLESDPPPLAWLSGIQAEPLAPNEDAGFEIRATRQGEAPSALVTPDIATCPRCLEEIRDPADRRHRHPFANCTDCGPRFTVCRRIPYDRPNTSMSVFPLCAACSAEYREPGDRRFHAQPNACGQCGPRLRLAARGGEPVGTDDPIATAIHRLRDGAIVAVRGIGGFHLAVDARREEAVALLRRRKRRPRKPFALMARGLETVHRYCHVTPGDEKLLTSPIAPIVLMAARGARDLAPSIAPGTRELGFMLPVTPLHHLLLGDDLDVLVMTSGNITEEPIAIANDEALERLAPLADLFLLHDREILQRCDDSIARMVDGEPMVLRRSRGYVPAPVLLPEETPVPILACGGELKNAVALSRENQAFLSQHIGNLDNPAALDSFEKTIRHLGGLLEITPEAVAHDLHPGYLSTRWALDRSGLPGIGVQHHHAHLVSVMTENGVTEPVIGIILDGTGYGTDGTIWGGEVLAGDARGFRRHGWLEPFLLPGGTAAILEPWRAAASVLHLAYGEEWRRLDLPMTAMLEDGKVRIVQRMLDRKVNSPATSSCGRLFDAISAMLGLCTQIDYEAQAAIELEAVMDEDEAGSYALEPPEGPGPIPVTPLVRAVAEDALRGATPDRISARFHRSLAEAFAAAAESARREHGLETVGLSGGVFQNVHFLRGLGSLLKARGFRVLTHRRVPPNDGGLALGQLMVARARLAAPGDAGGPA